MAEDETLQVMIGDRVVQCRTMDDRTRLEPVGGILVDGTVEGYRDDELRDMVATLERYNERDAAQQLKALIATGPGDGTDKKG